mmetsp:Transcript_47946/g.136947  ORF Transcript_47946/g.136947 Transcript_47946/m.136947 type:complete len:304 (-) Transcript_47946:339-1250(-)
MLTVSLQVRCHRSLKLSNACSMHGVSGSGHLLKLLDLRTVLALQVPHSGVLRLQLCIATAACGRILLRVLDGGPQLCRLQFVVLLLLLHGVERGLHALDPVGLGGDGRLEIPGAAGAAGRLLTARLELRDLAPELLLRAPEARHQPILLLRAAGLVLELALLLLLLLLQPHQQVLELLAALGLAVRGLPQLHNLREVVLLLALAITDHRLQLRVGRGLLRQPALELCDLPADRLLRAWVQLLPLPQLADLRLQLRDALRVLHGHLLQLDDVAGLLQLLDSGQELLLTLPHLLNSRFELCIVLF